MKPLCFFLMTLLFVACGSSVPSYHSVTTNDQDTVEYNWDSKSRTATFDITSPSGIGGARILREYGAKPERILLQLRLKGLESLKFRFQDNEVNVSISSDANATVRQSATPSGGEGEMELNPDSEYWMPAQIVSVMETIPLVDGFIRVELPKAFYASNADEFSIEWIDFFR